MNAVLSRLLPLILLVVLPGGASAVAEVSPYRLFFDEPFSASRCEVVNAALVELAVIDATGELEVLSGDVVPFSFVDSAGYVYIDLIPAGVIVFADDADGFRTLWWLSLSGTIIDWDETFRIARETHQLPSSRSNVPCGVCEVIYDPAICGGCLTDLECDDFNECTDDICELGECYYFDNDAYCNDGDPCTEDDVCVAGVCTGFEVEGCGVVVDGGGSSVRPSPGISFSFCGSGASLAMCLNAFGLVAMSLMRRRL